MSVPSEPQIYVAPGVFNQAIEFYWQPPISDGGSNITSYILESANIGYISVLPPTRRKARVANLINQTDYLFTLKATNDFGNSNVAVYRSVQPGFAPERPSNLNVLVDLANIEPLLNISLTQPDTTNSSNITYNALTMYPLDNTGNIINNSSFIYERFSLPGQFDPITLIDTNTNYEYRGLIQSINDVRWSKYDTFFNFRINPNLPTNNLKLWLDPYDLTTLTLSNNKVIKWNDKSFNLSNANISESFAPTYDSANAMLSFSGTQYMNLPANTIPSSNTPYTMFIYTTRSNINLSNLWLLSSGTPSANLFLGAKINNGNIIQSWNGVDITSNLANFTLTSNLPVLSEFTYDGNTRRTYINGTLIHSEISINRNSGTSNNIIGSISTLNANLIGSIGEIVLYDRLLSDKERTSVENYLINKRSELSLRNYGNLSVWLDANDNNTLYNSNINEKITYHNPVPVWLDKSNNNNHAFQSNLSIAPLKKSTFGKDYLNFNSGYMISNIATLPFDAYLVVQLNNLNNINDIIGISPVANNYNSLSYNISANRWSNDSTSNTFVSSNSETSTGFVMMEYSLANNNAFIRRNGSNIASVTNFNWSLPNNSILYIGNDNGITFNNSLKGNIGEIIMFNKQLNDNERFPVEGYLAWKWGIQKTLPSTHIFYNRAPSLFSFSSGTVINGIIIGGTVTTNGIYTINTFSTVGNTTCVVSGNPIIADILIVAGGGGSGGGQGAGGGGGGVVYRTNITLTPGTYNITVGNGGLGGATISSAGQNGENSVFGSLVALGGGGGGADATNVNGQAGGSGGGGNAESTTGTGGAGLQPSSASGGYGNSGAAGFSGGPAHGAGGGGGAGSPGTQGNSTTGGNGGNGIAINITGTNVYYGGGGGGGTYDGDSICIAGTGGLGGGGNGANTGSGSNGQPNTGGGGGGGGTKANGIRSNGGSGIIIIRYVTSVLPSPPRGLIPTDIRGLIFWIDSNDTSTFTLSSSTVSTLRDKSTNSYLFTGGSGFTYNVTKFNTLYPSFYNSSYASSNRLGSASVSINQPFTAFYVGNLITGPYGYMHDSTSASNRIAFHMTTGEVFAGNFSISGTNITTQNFIVCANYNTNNSAAYLNGSTTPYGTGDIGSNNLTALLLGNRFSLSEPWTGHICEILFFRGVLSVSDRQKVEGYLANKWGLQSNLPSNHPFKNSQPTLDITTFNPISVPGIQIWLDAMDSSTVTVVNNKVTKWTDKVYNIEATNSNTSSQPSYVNNSIFFNGNYIDTAHFLDIPAFDFGTSNRSLFFVIKINSSSDHWFWPNTGGGTNSLSLTGNVSVNIQGTQILGTSTINNSQYQLVEYVFGDNTGVGKLYINGTLTNTHTKSTGGTSFSNATSGYRLGWLNTSGFNFSFNGNMSEILLFNTNVSSLHREIIEGYLAWKWSIQSSLPSIHPYKNAAPSFSKYTINYSIGTGGTGGTGAANGSFGTSSAAIINGRSLVANGGSPGTYNNNATAAGGTASGGDLNMIGGTGRGSSGDSGGGGGGAIGTSNATNDSGSWGDKGADAANIGDLFTVLTSLGLATANNVTTYGSATNSSGLNNKGYDATGFGAGGGGAGYWGGDGGAGLYGGGGGGASGYGSTWTGGRGGNGVIVLSMNNGTSNTNVLLDSGSSYQIPGSIVSVRIWVIGAGGGGSGATTDDGDSGGGGGAGGVAYASITL